MASANAQQRSKPKGLANIPRLPRPMDWEALGQLRSVSILRIGYFGIVLIPLLAHIIIEWNVLVPERKISLPYSFFLTFLGSTILAIGHLLNEVMCPKLIKFYGTIQNFQKNMAEFVKNEDVIFQAGAEAERRIVAKLVDARIGNTLDDKNARIIALAITEVLDEAKQTPIKEEPLVTDYSTEWGAANTKFLCIRMIIIICYFAAAIIALYLSYRQLYNVYLAADF